jgi:hypothetical protein
MRASFIVTLVVVATAFFPTLCAPLEYVFVPLSFEILADFFVAPHLPYVTARLTLSISESAPFPHVRMGQIPQPATVF